MPPVHPLEQPQKPDYQQRPPRPALLLSTYKQLQHEVAAGVLDHFYHPQPCTWTGKQYKLPKDVVYGDALPARVRQSLILAGCGFPVEQLPADLRQALLRSRHVPSDLRNCLQATAAASSGGSSSSSSSSSGSDAYSSCSAWAEGFHKLCSANVELGLPLAMHPRLPLQEQHEFLKLVAQLGSPLLSTIMASHRQYLQQVVQEWPLLGTQGCIAAKDYRPKQWAMQGPLPSTALAVDCSALGEVSRMAAFTMNVAGTARHAAALMRAVLGRWQELPWLYKEGTAGVVLAGGALGACMAKPGGITTWSGLDLFIIAPNEAAYARVVDAARSLLDTVMDSHNIEIPAAGMDIGDPYRHSWVWQARVLSQVTSPSLPQKVKLVWWPYCSPAAFARTCDIPCIAAWFDGEEVFLDERCAWCHANRLLLADAFFDTASTTQGHASARFPMRLLAHALRLPGYRVLIPGPLSTAHFDRMVDGLTVLLKSTKPVASTKQRAGSAAAEAHDPSISHNMAMLLQGASTGIGRWALLVAYLKVFTAIPTVNRPSERIELLQPTATNAQRHHEGMCLVDSMKQKGWPFAGFSWLPFGGEYGGAALGDGNTWFSGGDLEELPRRVWLALHSTDCEVVHDDADRSVAAGSATASSMEQVAAELPSWETLSEFWESLSQAQCSELLTVDVDVLRARTKELAEHAQRLWDGKGAGLLSSEDHAQIRNITLEDTLEEAIHCLESRGTCMMWQWPPNCGLKDACQFFDGDSFRKHVHASTIHQDLLHLLPQMGANPADRPAAVALRQRMSDLLQRMQAFKEEWLEKGAKGNGGVGGRRRKQRGMQHAVHSAAEDGNVKMARMMLEALEQEHEQLYELCMRPVAEFVCDGLPEESRKSTALELRFEDLELLFLDDMAEVCEWLLAKVDALAAPIIEEDADSSLADFFELTPESTALTINSKWMQHLQQRRSGEDGSLIKLPSGEAKMSLVLECVYGDIFTSETEARGCARRQLGNTWASTAAAHAALLKALEEQATWEERGRLARELLGQVLQSRKEVHELATRYDITPVPTDEAAMALPVEVIVLMLKREVLLSSLKLHAVEYEHVMGDKALRTLKTNICRAEPEYERRKRDMERIKQAPRGCAGAFRTPAERERHRHLQADGAIKEQLDLQTAFKEQAIKLQELYGKKQRTEFNNLRRETEMKQLQGWRATVDSLIERFEDGMAQAMAATAKQTGTTAGGLLAASSKAEAGSAAAERVGVEAGTAGEAAAISDAELTVTDAIGATVSCGATTPSTSTQPLLKLCEHFHQTVRPQLYTEADDRALFNRVKDELKGVAKRLEDGRVALQHLELHLINVACYDPGVVIGEQLMLPILRERLDAAALEYAAKRAAQVDCELIRMEDEASEHDVIDRHGKTKRKKRGKQKK